jgi:hypothetical protein
LRFSQIGKFPSTFNKKIRKRQMWKLFAFIVVNHLKEIMKNFVLRVAGMHTLSQLTEEHVKL